MKVQRFEWAGAGATAAAVRSWSAEGAHPVEVDSIGGLVREGGDAAVLALTKRYDAPDSEMSGLRVDPADAAALCNAFAPEHLEIFEEDASFLAEQITTAGCVFAGRWGATAFGDYAAGSNHVLPTGGAGRFTGPLGPGAFRRRISTVEIDEASAAALAPSVAEIARAEGFPVHAESAMIRR